MVNRTMRPGQILSLIRKLARQHDLRVVELPGRGKGSHRIYALVDESGNEVFRFGLTGHGSKDLSWQMMRAIEEALQDAFGSKWTEK